jgi:hypothetical protein
MIMKMIERQSGDEEWKGKEWETKIIRKKKRNGGKGGRKFKGTVHEIFCTRFFSEVNFP